MPEVPGRVEGTPTPASPTGGMSATPSPETVPTIQGVERIGGSPYAGEQLGRDFASSDLAFWGDLAIAGSYDGFRVIDVSDPRRPLVLSTVVCRTRQGDVSVWGPLVFLSTDTPQTSRDCAGIDTTAEDPDAFEGIRIFDVADPAEPRFLAAVPTDCGSHTHTLIPDEDQDRVLLYVSSYAGNEEAIGPNCRNPHARISVVEVPLDAPARARVISEPALQDTPVHRWPELPPDVTLGLVETTGCHDVQVFVDVAVAAASCLSEGQLWDITDPVHPRVTHHIDHPDIEFWHSAAFTWDGEVVVFGDETFLGPRGCQDPSLGNLWFYSVRDPSEPLGRLAVPRMQGNAWPCTYHNFNVVPTEDRYLLVAGAYTAGVSVVDFTDPAHPEEVAFFDAGSPNPSNTWSAYWYDGFVYATDFEDRGLDVLALPGLPGGLPAFDRMNPQTQEGVLFGP
jgi:hypothetical protein